jgi:hypothetical protein
MKKPFAIETYRMKVVKKPDGQSAVQVHRKGVEFQPVRMMMSINDIETAAVLQWASFRHILENQLDDFPKYSKRKTIFQKIEDSFSLSPNTASRFIPSFQKLIECFLKCRFPYNDMKKTMK